MQRERSRIGTYSGRSTNWPALWIVTALAVPFVVAAVPSGVPWATPSLAVPLVIVTLAVIANGLTASSVRATAGPHGVAVRFGVFGWPRFRYSIERIASAEAVTIPATWWGWGILWSPRRGLMLTLRNGPALRVVLTNGRRITISTPDPELAAAVIDANRNR